MQKRVLDIKMFYGPMDKLDNKPGANNGNSLVNAITPEEKMHAFFTNEEVAKKDSFNVDEMVQSQAFDSNKGQMMVTITVRFSWEGIESERPSQKFDQKKVDKLNERETSKLTSRPPMVRQPETQVPVAPTAMPQRASSVPQVRSLGTPT